MNRERISRPHGLTSPGPDFVYRPQHTDLEKFGKNYAAAFGKGENVLTECPKCGRRHWTHQSCTTK